MRSSSPDLGYFQEGAIDWLRRNCLSISQSVSQARLGASPRLHLKDCLRREIAILCVPSGALREELREVPKPPNGKKQPQQIRRGSLAWKREAKDYATNEISSFRRDQNKLCPRCPLRRISNLEWSATDSHRSHWVSAYGEGTTRTAYYASIMNF